MQYKSKNQGLLGAENKNWTEKEPNSKAARTPFAHLFRLPNLRDQVRAMGASCDTFIPLRILYNDRTLYVDLMGSHPNIKSSTVYLTASYLPPS